MSLSSLSFHVNLLRFYINWILKGSLILELELCRTSYHLPAEESSYWSPLSNKRAEGAFPFSSEFGVRILMVESTSVVVNVWSMPTSHSKAAVVVFTVVTKRDKYAKHLYNLLLKQYDLKLSSFLSFLHIYVYKWAGCQGIMNFLENYLNRKVIYNRLCIAKNNNTYVMLLSLVQLKWKLIISWVFC